MKRHLLILTAAIACLTPACSNLTPEERALLVRTADTAIQLGLNKLAEPKPVPVKPQK